jgi:hypothetical protein
MRFRNVFVAAALVVGGALALSTPAQATTPSACVGAEWFVNPDEGDRIPDRTENGFVFDGTDLIHHNAPAGLTTDTLQNGAYNASPKPDQDSFFSVEVSGTDGGYATLRWNPLNHEWEMTTGGQFYKNSDPSKLVDMPPAKRSKNVVRFGVGYTKNPVGTVKTTVSSVSFMGHVYDLTCKPKPTATPTTTVSPTPTKTTTVRPTATRTTTSAAPVPVNPSGAAPSLPVTGVSLPVIVAAGGVFLVGGVVAIVATRRRTRFTA